MSHELSEEILSETPVPIRPADWQTAGRLSLIITASLRLGLGLAMALIWLAIQPYIHTSASHYSNAYGQIQMPTTFPGNALLGVWPRWDAVHYLNLALLGYANAPRGDSVYYPLYVLLTRAFTFICGGNVILAGLLVATIATFAAFTGLYLLGKPYGQQTAVWSVLALAVYPTALFLIAPFTESLFLALTLWAFFACYRQQWGLGGLLGFFASLARGPGAFNALSFAVIIWQWWQTTKRAPLSLRQILSILSALLLPLAGSLAFIIWREAMGFAPVNEVLQEYSGLLLTNPVSGFMAGVQQWLRLRDFNSTLDMASALIFMGLTALMIRKPEWRKPEWLVYLITNLCLFLSKESQVASSLQSMSRYVLILFPAFIALGHWLARQNRRVQFSYLTISSAVQIVFSMLYTVWIFIG